MDAFPSTSDHGDKCITSVGGSSHHSNIRDPSYWPVPARHSHINIKIKELSVVWIFLQEVSSLEGVSICFQMGNQMAVQCLNCQGSSRSHPLLQLSEKIFSPGPLSVCGDVVDLFSRSAQYLGGCTFPSGGRIGPLDYCVRECSSPWWPILCRRTLIYFHINCQPDCPGFSRGMFILWTGVRMRSSRTGTSGNKFICSHR